MAPHHRLKIGVMGSASGPQIENKHAVEHAVTLGREIGRKAQWLCLIEAIRATGSRGNFAGGVADQPSLIVTATPQANPTSRDPDPLAPVAEPVLDADQIINGADEDVVTWFPGRRSPGVRRIERGSFSARGHQRDRDRDRASREKATKHGVDAPV